MRGQQRLIFICHSAGANASIVIFLSLPLEPAQTLRKSEIACRCLFLHIHCPQIKLQPACAWPSSHARLHQDLCDLA
jgi:hypothetical protein